MEEKRKELLVLARHKIGLFTIQEYCEMFDMSRYYIDLAVNSGELEFVSPNNRQRFIDINDFQKWMKKKKEPLRNLEAHSDSI